MFLKSRKVNVTSIIEKCNRELEVKYTKLLTREFCMGWIELHLNKAGQKATLIKNDVDGLNRQSGDKAYSQFRLDVIEENDASGDALSICSCLVFALDIEVSLKLDLDAGAGSCVFY